MAEWNYRTRPNEAESLLLSLGFVKSNKGKTSGSRIIFKRNQAPIVINKPHPQKELQPYQILDILKALKEEEII